MNITKFYSKLTKDSEVSMYIKVPVLTFSSWLFQGILYMDKTEKAFKFFFDMLLFIILALFLNLYLNSFPALCIALLLSHTFNWIFNGQIFVLMKNLKLIRTDIKDFNQYITNLKKKAENEKSIYIISLIGSLSRDELKETSDLDIRIIRKKGFINGIGACMFTMTERSKAFFNKFPLDIYVGDNLKFLKKVDEQSIIIFKDGEYCEILSKE